MSSPRPQVDDAQNVPSLPYLQPPNPNFYSLSITRMGPISGTHNTDRATIGLARKWRDHRSSITIHRGNNHSPPTNNRHSNRFHLNRSAQALRHTLLQLRRRKHLHRLLREMARQHNNLQLQRHLPPNRELKRLLPHPLFCPCHFPHPG